jgi:hypothetical protein
VGNFWYKNLNEEDNLEYLWVNERIILKWMIENRLECYGLDLSDAG